jgi:hypothetical protein
MTAVDVVIQTLSETGPCRRVHRESDAHGDGHPLQRDDGVGQRVLCRDALGPEPGTFTPLALAAAIGAFVLFRRRRHRAMAD